MRKQSLTRFTVLASLLVIMALLVAACGGGEEAPTPPPTRPPTVAPTPGPTPTPAPSPTPTKPPVKTGGTITARNISEWVTWDTWHRFGGFSSQMMMNMFSNLLHPSLTDLAKLEGDLAESWNVSQDGLTYTFKLRPGVKWHDGKDFTAADVQWNFERGMKPPDQLITFNFLKVQPIESVTAPDNLTVVLRLKAPSAGFLGGISYHAFLMYPPHVPGVVKKEGPAIGTGPFKYKRWAQNQLLELVRNENYYKKDEQGRSLPYADALTFFTIVGDPTLAKSAFLTGQVNCACGFDHDWVTVSVDELKSKIPGVKVSLELADQFNLIFNFTKAPFTDQRVRQAFSMMLDRRALVALPRGGHGRFPPAHIHSPEFGGQWGLPVAELEKFPGFGDFAQELEGAKKLLQQAGVDPKSLDLTFSAILNPNVDPYHLAAASLIGNSLKAIGGGQINIDQKPGTAWSQAWISKAFDITMSAGGTSYDDPNDTFLEHVSTKGSRNLMRFDYGVDDLIAQQNAALDVAKRRDIVWQIQRKLINDATYVPAVYQVDGYATQPFIEGYIAPKLSVGPNFRLERVWINR